LKKTLPFTLLLGLGLLLAAEISLQILAAISRTVDAALSPTPVRGFVADRELSWRGNPEFPEHDGLGFRNASVPEQAEIIALGDSQTYGSNVSRDAAWPHQLNERAFGSSYNMAFPGWGPLQSYLILDEALTLRPRLIIEAIYFGNDLVDSFTFVYQRDRLEQFKSTDEDVRRALGDASDAQPWDDNPIANQSPVDREREIDPESSPSSPEEWIRESSRLYGLWSALGRAYDYYQRHPVRPEADEENDPLRDDDHIRFHGSAFDTVLTPTYRLPAVQLSDPRVEEGLRITVDALREMRQRSASSGADFQVLFIPTKELALADVVALELGSLPQDLAFYASAEERARMALHDSLADEHIPVIDTLPVLQQLAQDGTLPYSETRDGHLSTAGHRAVADLIHASVARPD
jgi:hypothetical protein